MAISKIQVGNTKHEVHDSRIHDIEMFYGTCDTAAATAAKEVVCPSFTADDYKNGTVIYVKFSYANTAGTAVTLNVNNTHAVSVKVVYNSAVRDIIEQGQIRTMVHQFIYTVTDAGVEYWLLAGTQYNSYYLLQHYAGSKPAKNTFYGYRILFSSADDSKWVPANTSSSVSANTLKTVNQEKINPFGPIVYYFSTTTVSAGSSPSGDILRQQTGIGLGYSFNKLGTALTLTPWLPVYIKCAPQTDGSVIIDETTPYVQVLPSSEDGKVYIYLGLAYSAIAVELEICHPVYYYKDGAIRQWVNQTTPDLSPYYQKPANGIPATDLETGVIPSVPTISTNVETDMYNNTKTVSPKAVYDEIHPNVESTIPSGGLLPNIPYNLGTIDTDTTITLASPANSSIINHYYFTFDIGSTVPTITWPQGLSWYSGAAITISANKHYEISILNSIAIGMEV